MKKNIKFLCVALMAALLSSCGGGAGKSDEEANSVKLIIEPQLGELSEYMSISDNEVVVKLDEEYDSDDYVRTVSSLSINVKNGGVASDDSYKLKTIVLDENHIEIGELPKYDIDDKTDNEIEGYRHVLYAGNQRAVMKGSESAEKWEKIKKRGKYLSLKPYWNNSKYIRYKSSDSSNASSGEETGSDEIDYEAEMARLQNAINDEEGSNVSSSNSQDKELKAECEQALEEYKKLTKEAVALSKKVKAGDEDAKIELAKKVTECTALSNKLMQLLDKYNDPQLAAKFQNLTIDYAKGMK